MDAILSQLILSSKKLARASLDIIPYLKDPVTRPVMIEKLKKYIKYIHRFNWTADQFEYVNELYLAQFINDAINNNNIQFVIYASRHYITPINLVLNIQPEDTINYLDGNDMVTVYIPNPDLDSLKGFLVPCPMVQFVGDLVDYHLLYERYLEGMTDEEVEFWDHVSLDNLQEMKLWSLVSKNYISKCAQNGNSYPMLTTYPQLLYPSMRPITDMSLFQTPLSKYYKSMDDIPNYKIAVTRYSTGMSKGKYYDTDRPTDTCGYFYYYQPESTTYLTYNNAFTSFNKTTAARELIQQVNDQDMILVQKLRKLSRANNLSELESHISGALPADLMMTAKQYDQEPDLGDRQVYVGVILDLYAFEDKLDQPLCKLASMLGYDIVILTHMIGSHQVVTEVLDTRSDSFQHLWLHH